MRPLKFVLPHEPGLRPAWMIRLGLFLYDHLARRKRLEGSHMVSLRGGALGGPLRENYSIGFTYADCAVDDARLVVANAIAARELGASIRVGARLVATRRDEDRWIARIESAGGPEEIEARAIVNAAGPYVSRVAHDALRITSRKHARLVKGSHIVTRKLYDGDHAYILQNPDKRIVFAIPYEQDFTLIGTTDIAHQGAPPRSRSATRRRIICWRRSTAVFPAPRRGTILSGATPDCARCSTTARSRPPS